jgi:DNA processing protein
MDAGGRTIGVIGTPLNKNYPKENSELQVKIAKEHLLLSQVPFYQYTQQSYIINKNFFLERNKTMSALSEGSLIVEAGETSGSLTQAVAAVRQGRKLFIWETCFKNKKLTWPQKFADKGAIRVSSYEEIRAALKKK